MPVWISWLVVLLSPNFGATRLDLPHDAICLVLPSPFEDPRDYVGPSLLVLTSFS